LRDAPLAPVTLASRSLSPLTPPTPGCVLTVILLMRALDPLGYERETVRYFETLRAVDPVRGAYFADLRSRYLMENAILKMEYAETRVIELTGKVRGSEVRDRERAGGWERGVGLAG